MSPERSPQLGDTFRAKIIEILKNLGMSIIGTIVEIDCVEPAAHCTSTQSHTIDIVAQYLSSFERVRKTVLIESKRAIPSGNRIKMEVSALVNKAICYNVWSKKPIILNEGLLISQGNMGTQRKVQFNIARSEARSNNQMNIEFIYGSKFRLYEAASIFRKELLDDGNEVSILPSDKTIVFDVGCLNPFVINTEKVYICGLRNEGESLGVFKIFGDSYSEQDLIKDIEWTRTNDVRLKEIHSAIGFVDSIIPITNDLGIELKLIDHNLNRTHFGNYLNYTRIN